MWVAGSRLKSSGRIANALKVLSRLSSQHLLLLISLESRGFLGISIFSSAYVTRILMPSCCALGYLVLLPFTVEIFFWNV